MRKFFVWEDGKLIEKEFTPKEGYEYELLIGLRGNRGEHCGHWVYCRDFDALSLCMERLKPLLIEKYSYSVVCLVK